MTQALLNNLNLLQDSSCLYKNKSSAESLNKDFEKVLDKKQNVKKQETKEDKKSPDTKSRELSAATDPTLKSSIQEEVVLDMPKKEEDILPDDNINEEITNITEEDSTMEKDLTPITNPTVAIMLQSHSTQKQDLPETENETKQLSTFEENETIDSKNFLQQRRNEVFLSKVTKNAEIKQYETKTQNLLNDEMAEELNIESVSSSDANNSSGDVLYNQNPSEQGIKLMIQGDVKYEDVNLKIISSAKPANNGVEISSSKIIEQITKQMEGMYNSSRVNIVLNPESLGRVAVQIINSKEGLAAQFIVNNQETRELLMKGMTSLRESLLAQGINVDSVVVKMSEDASVANDNLDFNWSEGSRGGNKEQGSKQQQADDKQFEQAMFEISQNG